MFGTWFIARRGGLLQALQIFGAWFIARRGGLLQLLQMFGTCFIAGKAGTKKPRFRGAFSLRQYSES